MKNAPKFFIFSVTAWFSACMCLLELAEAMRNASARSVFPCSGRTTRFRALRSSSACCAADSRLHSIFFVLVRARVFSIYAMWRVFFVASVTCC